MSDVPKDTDNPTDSATPALPEKLSPKGIAGMQGQEVTADDVQKRVEQLRAETEAKEATELAALNANQVKPVTTIAPDTPQPEPITTLIPDKEDVVPQPPTFRPGYHAEVPASPEHEPLDEKPTREKPVSPEGGSSGNPERGG